MRKYKQNQHSVSKKQNTKALRDGKRAAAKRKNRAVVQQKNKRRKSRDTAYYTEQFRVMMSLCATDRKKEEPQIGAAAAVLSPVGFLKAILGAVVRPW